MVITCGGLHILPCLTSAENIIHFLLLQLGFSAYLHHKAPFRLPALVNSANFHTGLLLLLV